MKKAKTSNQKVELVSLTAEELQQVAGGHLQRATRRRRTRGRGPGRTAN